MLVLLFVALWFILRGDLFYVLNCVILFLCFLVLFALWLPRLGKWMLILVLFVRLLDLWLFGFAGFLFLLVSGKGCGLWLWHSLDFSFTFFCVFFVFKGNPFLLLFYSTVAAVVPCGGRKNVSLYIFIVQVIFYFLWDHLVHTGYFENRISLKPALGVFWGEGDDGWGGGGGGGVGWEGGAGGGCILRNYSVAYE